MKILKEEKIEEYECPKCNSALELERNEVIKKYFLKIIPYNFWTGNAWFNCNRCNRTYLIEERKGNTINYDD